MIKAIAGGGGRGMRIVDDASKLEEAYARCQSEAMAAFGSDGVYVERLIRNARHIEVQIICDHLARSAISGSANAPSSAATRNSSRSRRARR
jgi:pyruvate carboxylase